MTIEMGTIEMGTIEMGQYLDRRYQTSQTRGTFSTAATMPEW
jgi:hypothetical protein